MRFDINPLCLAVLAIVLAIIHPVTAYPIGTAKWVKTGQIEDPESHGLWSVFEKEEREPRSEMPPAKPKQVKLPWSKHGQYDDMPESTSRRGSSEPEQPPHVSLLVPVAPAKSEEQTQQSNQEEHQQSYSGHGADSILAYRLKHYGRFLGLPGRSSKQNISRLSLQSFDFFSWRISIPCLRLTPSFPQRPLPGIFATAVILLALVWVSIFAIGVFELGSYLWQQYRRGGNDSVGWDDDEQGDDGAKDSLRDEIVLEDLTSDGVAKKPRNEGGWLSSCTEYRIRL